ncbi:MAG: GntR family transcriptional regulator [Nocardioides sp.]|uniref:GntR family transcriptional regulator n=1 Tax=Nocardioides sp. TaxID=35761 RepID=UPI0039E56DD1
MSDPATFASLSLDEPASTVERVAQELRRAIFDGELESGTSLREQALAASLGVARSTVREALAVLVAEGLADRAPNRGVSVTTPQADSVRDVCVARQVLEEAGVRSWPTATPAARDRVRRRLQEYISAIERGADYPELNVRHLDFHLSLVELTGSPRLIAMERQLAVELKLALAQVERIRRNAHDQAESHAALVALLDEDDIAGAATFLRAHLRGAAEEICAALGLDDWPAPDPPPVE